MADRLRRSPERAYADGRFDERKAIAEWLEAKGLNLYAIEVMRRAHLGYEVGGTELPGGSS